MRTIAAALAAGAVLVSVATGAAAGTLPRAADRLRVAPPSPPRPYRTPAHAVTVSTSEGLQRALRRHVRTNIVLADGVYAWPRHFTNAHGHRLYAEHLGGAVLRAGLVMGANWGPGGGLVRGVVFDVTDPGKTFDGGIIHTWGPGGVNSRILDTVFRGHRVVADGLLARNPEGLVAQRLVFTGFTDNAIRASDNVSVPYGAATPRIASITDITVDGVSRSVPGASNGTAEAGLWIGHPVTGGVQRIRVRNVAWSGIEAVNNSWNTSFTDLDIDMSGPDQAAGVGIYLEHYSYYNSFQRFRISGAKTGITAEWADPAWGGIAGAHYTTIRDGEIDAAGSTLPGNQAGVYLDAGTETTTITGVTFTNQNWAAIGAYNTTGQNTFTNNDYTRLDTGAVPVTARHIASG